MSDKPVFPRVPPVHERRRTLQRARTRAEIPALDEDTPTYIAAGVAEFAPMGLMTPADITHLSGSLELTRIMARNPTLSDEQVAQSVTRWCKRIRNIGSGSELASMDSAYAAISELDAARGGLPDVAITAATGLIDEEMNAVGHSRSASSDKEMRQALLHCRNTVLPEEVWRRAGNTAGWRIIGKQLMLSTVVTDELVQSLMRDSGAEGLVELLMEEAPETLDSPAWRSVYLSTRLRGDLLARLARDPQSADEVRQIVDLTGGWAPAQIRLVMESSGMAPWFRQEPDLAIPLLRNRDPMVREMAIMLTGVDETPARPRTP